MNETLELKELTAAGRLETVKMQRDQAEIELFETMREAIQNGLPARASARAANMAMVELMPRLDVPPDADPHGFPPRVYRPDRCAPGHAQRPTLEVHISPTAGTGRLSPGALTRRERRPVQTAAAAYGPQ